MRKDTLCWRCNKTGGRCSWSRGFVPVEGWDAKPIKLKNCSGNYTKTFLVIECPEFEEFCPNYIPTCKRCYYEEFVQYGKFLKETDAQIFEYWLKHTSIETAQKFGLSHKTVLRKLANTKKKLKNFSESGN